MGSITPSSETSSASSISTCSCTSPHPPYPLHPSVLPKLDPTYKSFYDTHLVNNQVVHHQPLHISRSSSILLPGASDPLSVGSIFDLKIPFNDSHEVDIGNEKKGDRINEGNGEISVRVFIPKGEKPDGGWPLCMYFHGGGWVLGGIETENTGCTHLCQRGEVVVVSVDYRLAPENPYPTAPNDCQTALLSILTHPTHYSLPINPTLLALSGSSAGGNIAAVLSHRFSSLFPHFRISLQLLIVPVTDNTASPSTYPSWKENEFSPALPAEKMMWFRNYYLPDQVKWGDVDASPLLNDGGWEEQPRTLVVVGELDVLRDEGIAYAGMVGSAGVKCRLEVMRGMPHPFLAMDGVLKQGAQTITYMVEELRDVFWKGK
ncbi:hypothetical protein SS1G_02163 [Sclerotinia sclerotiorum 1980 UF-70]|uniref:Alpha/beta hydrolase fold-3 domain-containing protein n=2 Tax=Sclerotinia sclerotiorum (strain ATCC 18683 / 1980 / Ss-1) TaxID=665079 RepID=A7EA32_SCLS1|nr:hypothetical protein SS1G_02163 [Sclerotinia sclerotiorum 1980 UF-70]APA08470.1 hypothetical protein sscle_04g032400 [Sclerotinia sclerotiorum 1980 UF-70]EDN99310.1 hypothetical protein SS1G_02163 [Sclerotinia sclerotiorum 1980 UF-70]